MDDASRVSSLLGLAPGGGCLAARIAADAGGLLHRLFTLTLTLPPSPASGRGVGGEGNLFLWPCSGRFPHKGIYPPRVLPGAVLFGVRTFLDPSLTRETATVRPA